MTQTKLCRWCSTPFVITPEDLGFYDKISPKFAGQTFAIPAPTLCPACRQQRRLAFRNERSLYRRTCDASGKQIVSFYSPNKPFKVYDQKVRRSDNRNATDYGIDFNFSQTFTENFSTLQQVPRMSMIISMCENCDYAPYCTRSKNCYMSISCVESEDILYSYQTNHSKSCLDSELSYYCEYCYEVIYCEHLHKSYYCLYCKDGSHLLYCQDCTACNDCIACVNLTNAQYCIFNKQYSKEEFADYKKNIVLDDKHLIGQWEEFLRQKENHISAHIINSDNVTGDFLINCSDCKECYNAEMLEHCAFVHTLPGGASYCYDLQYSPKAELVYNAISAVDSKKCIALLHSRDNRDCYYLDECYYNNNCFGCIGLRNKSYCIFNKQYTKDEYEKLAAKIISHMQETGEWGEFFDPTISPFGYNETVAQEYYPTHVIARTLNEVNGDVAISEPMRSPRFARDDGGIEMSQFGFQRSTYQSPLPKSDKIINAQDLPQTIQEVDDTILQYAIECEVTSKLFRIQPQELAFYRKHTIPLPRRHPDQRHLDRLALRK